MRQLIITLLCALTISPTMAMPADSTVVVRLSAVADTSANSPYRFRPTQLIVPATLAGAGLIITKTPALKDWQTGVRDDLQRSTGGWRTKIDDYVQFAPMAASFALKAMGVKSRDSYGDMLSFGITSFVIMHATTKGLKKAFQEPRPDGRGFDSFPSGHTATAFAGAELLREQYWDTNPWIGIGGYAVATATAGLRMVNNRHWVGDVLAGAGLGILSVQVAQWIYPAVAHGFFNSYLNNAYISPIVTPGGAALSYVATF